MPRAQNSRRPLLFRSGPPPAPPYPPPSPAPEWASPWAQNGTDPAAPKMPRRFNSDSAKARAQLGAGLRILPAARPQSPLYGEREHGRFPCSSSPSHPVGDTAKAVSNSETLGAWPAPQSRKQPFDLTQFRTTPPAAWPVSLCSVLYKTLCWKSLGGSETTALAGRPPSRPAPRCGSSAGWMGLSGSPSPVGRHRCACKS